MTKKQLTVIEGPRGSGKTYMLENAGIKKVYKFPFVHFVERSKMVEGPVTHAFGYSKEIMLHDLIKHSFIDEHVVMDRGVVSHWVWSLINCRQEKQDIVNEIVAFKQMGYFNFMNIVFVMSEEQFERGPKDRYDDMDYQTELEAYQWVLQQIQRVTGPQAVKFVNNGTDSAVKSFRNLMFSLDVELDQYPVDPKWPTLSKALK